MVSRMLCTFQEDLVKEIKVEMLKYSDLDGHLIVGFPRDVAQMETFESQARVEIFSCTF